MAIDKSDVWCTAYQGALPPGIDCGPMLEISVTRSSDNVKWLCLPRTGLCELI